MNAKLIALILLGGVIYLAMHEDVTLFNNFLADGSLWAVLLMTYASSVCHDIIKISKDDALAAEAPKLFSSPLASLLILINIPGIILSAIYIGYYDGWLAGIAAYFLLQVVSFSLSRIFNFKSTTTTFFFWTAIISCIAAYLLGYIDITNQSIAHYTQPYQTLALDLWHIVKTLVLETISSLKNWISQLMH